LTSEPESGRPRAHVPLTEAERRNRASRSAGDPARDWAPGSTPYIDYQSIDTLLDLQHPRTDERAEMTLFVMGQVMELLFKLLYVETCRARDDLFTEDLDGALWVLRRTDESQRVLEACWDVLATVSPSEFVRFRDELGGASGVGSYMYRQLEFVLGNKSPGLAALHADVPGVTEEVAEALRAPSVWEAANWFLSTRGHSIGRAYLDQDPSLPHPPDDTVVAAWTAIYANPKADLSAYRLGEALSDLAHRHHRWRGIHLLVVERILGSEKPGSGGTEGLEWLRRSADHRVFPELLLARGGL
jgi:tryptophan 2,3-dioxygenase